MHDCNRLSLRKEERRLPMGTISRLWVNRIIAGSKSYDEVPPKLKEEVAQGLKANGHEELIKE